MTDYRPVPKLFNFWPPIEREMSEEVVKKVNVCYNEVYHQIVNLVRNEISSIWHLPNEMDT